MDWQTYEATVRNIYETLGKSHGVVIECYGNNCKRKGKSEVLHQIDVLTSHSDGIHSYTTAIECKYWDKKIDKEPITKLISILDECNIDKGVIVSKKGFTPDAIKFAKFTNVQLVELKEHNGASLGNQDKILVNLELTRATLDSINCIVRNEDRDRYNADEPPGKYSDFIVIEPNKIPQEVNDLVVEFLNKRVLKQKSFDILEETIHFPAGTYLKSKNIDYEFPIIGLTLKGYQIRSSILDIDYFENKIWMIMKVFIRKQRLLHNKDWRY